MKFYWFWGMLVCFSTNAAPIRFQSAERRTALVELYTSEGCSSCPPAESWLSKQKDAPGLWKDFVPVAFHIDYWDSLGWRDRWSNARFSDRQRAYANAWASDSVYTPEFVLNGKEWRSGFGRREMPNASGNKAGIFMVSSVDGNHWDAVFVPATDGAGNYEINVALLSSGVNSDVKAGENHGRRLKHDFVALTLVKEPLARGVDGFHGQFTLKPGEKDGLGQLGLAAWVTGDGEPTPLQAVGGWLLEPGKN